MPAGVTGTTLTEPMIINIMQMFRVIWNPIESSDGFKQDSNLFYKVSKADSTFDHHTSQMAKGSLQTQHSSCHL